MRGFVAVLFVASCAGLISASGDSKVNSESAKQEKRSLSHGIGNGYYSAGLSDGGFSSSGPISVSSGPSFSAGPSIISSGPGLAAGGPAFGAGPAVIASAGPAVVGGGASVGVSTNTNTFTTVRENVPVAVPVDRPVPV